MSIFPSPFVLKVHNGKYLRRMGEDVQAHDEQKGVEYGYWEAFYKPGHVAFRAVSGHYFWRYNRDWIKIDAYHNESNPEIWFRAIQISPTEVGLHCPPNGLYLYPLTADGKTDTLNACSSRLHRDYKTVFTVEPAVLYRRIENVVYDFDNKKETQEKPIAIGEVQVLHHGEKIALTVNRTVSFTVTKEKSWNTSSTFREGVEMSVEVPVYAGVEAGFTASSVTTQVQATGNAKAETVKDETTVNITAQPHHKTTAHFILSRGSLTLPYSYDETVQQFNGTVDKKHKTDGVFKSKEAGVFANWNIKVEKLPEGIIETLIDDLLGTGEAVAEAGADAAKTGVKTVGTTTTTVVKTGADVTNKATTVISKTFGGILGHTR